MANMEEPLFIATLEEAGYSFSNPNLVQQMLAICAEAQNNRAKSGSSTQRGVTRSTALVALNYLNPNISLELIKYGLQWERFADLLNIGQISLTDYSVQPTVHENLRGALLRAPSTYHFLSQATPEALAVAVLSDVVNNSSGGLLGSRLEKFDLQIQSIDFESLHQSMTPPEGAIELGDHAWVMQFSDDEQYPLLSAIGEGGRVFQPQSVAEISTEARAGDRVVFRNIGETSSEEGDVIGFGYVVAPLKSFADGMDKDNKDISHYSLFTTHIEKLFFKQPIPLNVVELKEELQDLDWSKPVLYLDAVESESVFDLVSRSQPKVSDANTAQQATTLNSELLDDNPEIVEDLLGRGTLAIVTARILHRVWMRNNDFSKRALQTNEMKDSQVANTIGGNNFKENALTRLVSVVQTNLQKMCNSSALFSSVRDAIGEMIEQRINPPSGDAAFIFHLDAPWGGGKTTFSNYLAYVLNPTKLPDGLPRFLGSTAKNQSEPFPYFLTDPPLTRRHTHSSDLPNESLEQTQSADLSNYPDEARRGWLVVRFNAWKAQHVNPPWWNFYQSFRSQCLEQLGSEGIAEFSIFGDRPQPSDKESKNRVKTLKWLERYWLFSSPKARRLLLLSIVCFSLFVLFKALELDSADGLITTLLTGSLASGLWSAITVVTESVVPSSDSFTERLNLGEGDPLKRFSKHFSELCSSLNRPIIVLIDDLDRCDESYITGLMHGLQTILRSPKVIYVLIGDKDWVEKAFNSTYSNSENDKHDSATISVGAKFVEKAIQLSLLLPKPSDDDYKIYIDNLLGVQEKHDDDQLDDETDLIIKSAVQKSSIDNVIELKQVGIEAVSATHTELKESILSHIENIARQEAAKKMSEEIGTDKRIAHALQSMHHVLPTNPRQIKRLINSITIYLLAGVAYGYFSQNTIDYSKRWEQLVMWIVLCTEQPFISRVFASRPWLLDAIHLAHAENKNDLDRLFENELSTVSERDNARKWVNSIYQNYMIYGILSTSSKVGDERVQLHSGIVTELLNLTPLSPADIPAMGKEETDGAGNKANP